MVPFSIIFVGEFCVTIYRDSPYRSSWRHKGCNDLYYLWTDRLFYFSCDTCHTEASYLIFLIKMKYFVN